MSKFIDDIFLQTDISTTQELVEQDEFNLNFSAWKTVKNVATPKQKINYTMAVPTGEGATVTAGEANVSLVGITTNNQTIDFHLVENIINIPQAKIDIVGEENMPNVLTQAKIHVFASYAKHIMNWYVTGKAVQSISDGGTLTFNNDNALLSMKSRACVNITTAKPTTIAGWQDLFANNILAMISKGYLVRERAVLIDPLLLAEIRRAVPLDNGGINLGDWLEREQDLYFVPAIDLLNTGKLLIFDPRVKSVEFIIGKEPDYLVKTDGSFRDGMEETLGGQSYSKHYITHTEAIVGNVAILKEKSMLAIELS